MAQDVMALLHLTNFNKMIKSKTRAGRKNLAFNSWKKKMTM